MNIKDCRGTYKERNEVWHPMVVVLSFLSFSTISVDLAMHAKITN
jgi:hypothetical protein